MKTNQSQSQSQSQNQNQERIELEYPGDDKLLNFRPSMLRTMLVPTLRVLHEAALKANRHDVVNAVAELIAGKTIYVTYKGHTQSVKNVYTTAPAASQRYHEADADADTADIGSSREVAGDDIVQYPPANNLDVIRDPDDLLTMASADIWVLAAQYVNVGNVAWARALFSFLSSPNGFRCVRKDRDETINYHSKLRLSYVQYGTNSDEVVKIKTSV